jgi:hypothetical protein
MAMLVLFRMSTGDNWNSILKDAMLESPYCDDRSDCEENCCANPVIAAFYFTSFCLISTFVMLNLVIAVLMAELEDASDEEPEEEEGQEVEAEGNKIDKKTDRDPEPAEIMPGISSDSHSEEIAKRDVADLEGQGDVEETTDTLERQVNEALEGEPEKDAQGKIENLEAEVEEIVSYNQTPLPPLPSAGTNSKETSSGTDARPSHFVPFAPALVATDEPEDENPN